MQTDTGPKSPDGYIEQPSPKRPRYIGGRPDQEAVDALERIRREACAAGEVVSYGLAGDALRKLGVEV